MKAWIGVVSLSLLMLLAVAYAQISQPEISMLSYDDLPVNDIAPGVHTRFVVGDTIMLNRVLFDEGAMSPLHNHSEEQIVTLISGRMRVASVDREYVLEPGDVVIFPAYVLHQLEALEESVTIETLGPGGHIWRARRSDRSEPGSERRIRW